MYFGSQMIWPGVSGVKFAASLNAKMKSGIDKSALSGQAVICSPKYSVARPYKESSTECSGQI